MLSKFVKCSTIVASIGVCDAFSQSRALKLTNFHHFTVFADQNADLKSSVADFRKDYSQKGLVEGEILQNPMDQFSIWFKEAVESNVLEPNAMCLSTCVDNKPSSRIVLLKGFDERGFVWYTNYSSRKGSELEHNPYAALTFWWGDLERQVRIEGVVEKVATEQSDEYFNCRPRGSRIGAWSSNQSQPIASREDLEKQEQSISERFAGDEDIPRPSHWGGYRLRPTRIEFWKGRTSRLHDRLVFSKDVDGLAWRMERFQP